MDKTYQISFNNKNLAVSAPVIARIGLAEPAPDMALVAWLGQHEVNGEKGIVIKRVGGIAMVVVGAALGLFSLLFFPGLFFWLLGAAALGLISQGVLLMFSKRSKKPDDAFKKAMGEAYFVADQSTVSFQPRLFREPADIKKRLLTLYPIEGMVVDDDALIAFLNSFEQSLISAFERFGGPQTPGTDFGIQIEPDVEVQETGSQLSYAQGTINVIRRQGGTSQIIEVSLGLNILDIGGYKVPVNLVPRILLA